MKDLRLLFILVLTLLCTSLVSCGGGPEPSPESPEQPAAEQSSEAVAPAPAQEPEASAAKSADEMTPCKIVNVDDSSCTSDLGNALTEILVSQGESEDAAKMAGGTIAEAIQKAPLDKRNGFKMRGLESGKDFSFLFQKVNNTCTLQLFDKTDGENYTIITSRTLPNCTCDD